MAQVPRDERLALVNYPNKPDELSHFQLNIELHNTENRHRVRLGNRHMVSAPGHGLLWRS
jgi:hypothetical protein